MRKRKKGKKLSLKTDQRRAFLKILASNLVMKEKIKTTKTRAKQILPIVEKAVNLAKKGNLRAVRELNRSFSAKAAQKIIKDIAPRYTLKQSGFVRMMNIGQRFSDSAAMAIIEFVKQ